MAFTQEELAAIREADREIEETFSMTHKEWLAGSEHDREAKFSNMDNFRQKRARQKKAYYQKNRDKVAEYNRTYYQSHKEKLKEHQLAYYRANRETINARRREKYKALRTTPKG